MAGAGKDGAVAIAMPESPSPRQAEAPRAAATRCLQGLNHCRSKGTLGPARYRVPASPTRFRFAGDQEVTLCSAIVCAACRAPVRWFDGGQLGAGQDARQLVYSNGLQPIEGFDPRSCPSRLYVCRG